MAEGDCVIYRRFSTRDENRQTEIEELYRMMEEVSLDERVGKGTKCESCVSKECGEGARSESYERVRQLYGRVAAFFCFLCEMFVCAECLPKHKFHEGIKVERKAEHESEGMDEQGLSERMRLHSKKFLDDVMNESEIEREEKILTNKVSIIDRIEVKHELDLNEECLISGLCGLENKRLVVCDQNNFCIKIFKLGSYVLQRYIRFVGSGPEPWDVTEIEQNSTEQNLVSGSSSDISATDRADPDKQCLIAVTLSEKRQIMFIDLSKKPAETQKIIKTDRQCHSIQFYDNKIFTSCTEDPGYPYSVYILSTDGDTLNKFYTGLYGDFVPYLAVVSGRVYLTDMRNNKVECRHVEGQVISEITIEGSGSLGISVDPDNNVYICAQQHNKVYKLDADLTEYKSVLDQTAGYIKSPEALCYYRDKLFISHIWPPTLKNFVTVVLLL